MLSELRIKNFAIIENIDLNFRGGMNVMTGETGAGKSIIIQAVNLILGERAATNLVRSGEKEAIVEALFSVGDGEAKKKKLEALGIDADEDIVIRRVISQEGKNKVYINGTLATLSMLTDLAEGFISISSQHEHQSLLRSDHHLLLLDSYGKLWDKREEFQASFGRYKEIRQAWQKLKNSEKDLSQRIDLLNFQLSEIDKAEIRSGEDEELKEEKAILANAEKLSSAAAFGDDVLYSSEDAIIGRLGEVISKVSESAAVDPALEETLKKLEENIFQLEDAALSLRDYAGNITVDPLRLEAVEERLAELDRLKKKYGPSLDDVIQLGEKIRLEVESLQGGESSMEEAELRMNAAFVEAADLAHQLSVERKHAALKLSKEMETELADLGMSNSVFEVSFASGEEGDSESRETLNENGMDEIEFYLSTNPGEEPRPMAKIASGGELSRIMLALKSRILAGEELPTFIFDEVDSGIGGGTAEIVGEKIRTVSGASQVICITHLPQIAALSDVHYKVEKNIRGGRTFTTIDMLDEEQRLNEVARMLGGVEITEKTKEHAREMLGRNA